MLERRILLPSGGVDLWNLLFVLISVVMKICSTFSPVELYPVPGPLRGPAMVGRKNAVWQDPGAGFTACRLDGGVATIYI